MHRHDNEQMRQRRLMAAEAVAARAAEAKAREAEEARKRRAAAKARAAPCETRAAGQSLVVCAWTCNAYLDLYLYL